MKTLGVIATATLETENLPNKLVLPIYKDKTIFDLFCSNINKLPNIFSKYLFVSDPIFKNIASSYENIEVIDSRNDPPEYPQLNENINIKACREDYLMSLNPASIFIDAEFIESVITDFINSESDSSVGVRILNNLVTGEELREENSPKVFQHTNSFYIFKKENFLNGKPLLEGCSTYVIPEDKDLEINNYLDYLVSKQKFVDLTENRKKYEVELDGTLFSVSGVEKLRFIPIFKNIGMINNLYKNGNQITIRVDKKISEVAGSLDFIKKQLDRWNIKYHYLELDKMERDFVIDIKSALK